MPDNALSCFRVEISGIVQGVGFRPFIYRLATRHSLKGYVLNHDRGVTVEVEGMPEALSQFLDAIKCEAPPAARIDSVKHEAVEPRGYLRFEIRESLHASGDKYVPISPDLPLCEDCRQELWRENDRRYFYPFINCTNCGPRLTITKDVPYDRPKTTMAPFKMCETCQREYDEPSDRRFHAQPNACPKCGPHLSLIESGTAATLAGTDHDLIIRTVEILRKGLIVAVKGIGGFHLVCDASNEEAVARLRIRKLREQKAFAVMFADIETARAHAVVSEAEARELEARGHPVVLLEKRGGAKKPVAAGVAPKNRFLGVMLPYTPLHELLVRSFGGPLVMTSGNRSDEPIAFTNEDALERLRDIADYFLLHDREIHVRCDDSVVRMVGERRYFYRRSRGYVPEGIKLTGGVRAPILAVGGQLKNTICLSRGDEAILSHHVGDLENRATLESFENAIEHFKTLFNVQPQYVVHDLHPDYLSTKWVAENSGELSSQGRVLGVQHHHAHIAACLGENRFAGKCIGLALDGTGYGPDGTIWGGEVLFADQREYERVGRFKTVRLPGGAAAVKQPWRSAVSYLFAVGYDFDQVAKLPFLASVQLSNLKVIWQMLEKNANCYETSSCGRLFDGVSAMAGICDSAAYEGQAAIELENRAQLARELKGAGYEFGLVQIQKNEKPFLELDWSPVVKAIYDEVMAAAGDSRLSERISIKFHRGLVEALVKLSKTAALLYDVNVVALSGGCFLNEYLLTSLVEELKQAGLTPLYHRDVPTNDGGIAFGQAVIARQLAERE